MGSFSAATAATTAAPRPEPSTLNTILNLKINFILWILIKLNL